MCVIVDANVAGLVFRRQPHSDFVPVLQWLQNPHGDGCLVFGGQLATELRKVQGGRAYLSELTRAGRARQIPHAKLQSEERGVLATGLCRSDDPHVIALARISGARTLCSSDGRLHADFKNLRLISRPKGKVYQTAAHVFLLHHTKSCERLRRRK